MRLVLEGEASCVAGLVRIPVPMAIQGRVVVPMFAGYSEADQTGRLFSFDVVGGRYEEIDFGSTGSGSRLAKSYLRTVYRDDLSADEAADLAVRALVSASQEDTATGGPDLRRGIYPNVLRIDEGGLVELPDDVVGPLAEGAVETIR